MKKLSVFLPSVRLFQGVAFAALCFLPSISNAVIVGYWNGVSTAISACNAYIAIHNDGSYAGPVSCASGSGEIYTIPSHIWPDGSPTFKTSAPWSFCDRNGQCYPTAPSGDCDINGFSITTGDYCGDPSFGNPDDPTLDMYGNDQNGYDSAGCVGGLCPTDAGWFDPDGYDSDGFDANGLDRGGNNAASGGGYTGSAGTGGIPPDYIEPPVPVDPQNGNNRDINNNLQCYAAYPVTVSRSLLPPAVQDGLAGCSNECAYQPSATIWDFAAQEQVVQLVPTGLACTSEPAISVVDILTYVSPPIGQEPPEEYDNLNACYLKHGYFFCDHPLSSDTPDCYKNSGGWIGQQFECPSPTTGTLATFNGTTNYIDPYTNCQSFNGVIQCLDTDGNIIPLDSPDHAINGGNGDGDSTNDVYVDSADVIANGQATQDRVTQSLSAREIAGEIDSALRNEFSGLQGSLDDIADGIGQLTSTDTGNLDSDLSGLIGNIGDVGTDPDLSANGAAFTPIADLVGTIIPESSGCNSFDYVLHSTLGMQVSLDTCVIAPVMPLFEFFLYAITVISLFFIAIGSKEIE